MMMMMMMMRLATNRQQRRVRGVAWERMQLQRLQLVAAARRHSRPCNADHALAVLAAVAAAKKAKQTSTD